MESNKYFPLTFQQRGMLTEIEIKSDSSIYHIAKAFEIHTPICQEKLKTAYFLLLERHEALRITFFSKKGNWFQTTSPPNPESFGVIRLQNTNIKEFFNHCVSQIFDLEKGPLFSLYLIYTNPKKQYLFFHTHHLICDLWSLGVFLDELFSLYEGQLLSKRALSYFEFCDSQQKDLSRENIQESIEYWRKQISQPHFTSFKIPSDSSKIPEKQFTGAIEFFEINQEVSARIIELSKQVKCTSFSVFLTIFSYLLLLQTGHKTVSLGTTSHGRRSGKWARTIGLFSNPVPLFIAIKPNASFWEMISFVHAEMNHALRKHQLPYLFLLDSIRSESNQNPDPLFQTMFVYQQVPAVSGELKKLSLPSLKKERILWKSQLLSSVDWHYPFSPFDCSFYINELEGSFSGFIEYNKNLFSDKTLKTLILQFNEIFEFFVNNPNLNIANYPEKAKTAFQTRTYNILLPEILEGYAKLSPSSIALREGKRSLTFDKLSQLSNQVARFFIEEGIQADDLVAIHMNCTFETILTIIALWKIGAAFVPLDITQPQERIDQIIIDCKPKKYIKNLLLSFIEEHYSADPLSCLAEAESIAYLIYTSGSTGKPKGVAISQNSIMSYLRAIEMAYDFGSNINFAVYSSLSFDLTLTSIFLPLLRRCTISLYDRHKSIDEVLQEILFDPTISHLKCTPSHLKLFQWLNLSNSHIKGLIVGGEQLYSELAKSVLNQFVTEPKLINEYGPTETTIGCIFHEFTFEQKQSIVPIGLPLNNSSAFLLGATLHQLPEEVPGELYIGGDGVAYGYWGSPDLTAERFIPDLTRKGARIYRTKDFAQSSKQGHFVFLGREDEQIKIRGHRVEIGEIVYAIKKCHFIKDAIVLSQKLEEKSEPVLIAYCVYNNKENTNEILDFLARSLPNYMLPQLFIECDTIPLTSSGKVDHSLLPKIDSSFLEPANSSAFLEQIELDMRSIWSTLLNLKEELISIDTPFFQLGGDSIKAIQLVAMAREKNWRITASDIFELMTIRKLSHHLRHQNLNNHNSQSINRSTLPLTPIQKWFFQYNEMEPNYYNQAVTLSRKEIWDSEKVSKAFSKIIELQPLLRSRFLDSDTIRLANLDETLFGFSQFSLEKSDNPEDEFHEAKIRLHNALDIRTGPLIQLSIFNFNSESRLLIIIHHLLIDGVSWHLLLRLFEQLYSFDSEVQLEFKTLSLDHYYESFSANSLRYPQPTKFYDRKDQKTLHFKIDEKITNALLKLTTKIFNCTLQDFLAVALALSFQKITQEKELFFHLEGHGRFFNKNRDFSEYIGWFTHLTPILLKIELEFGLDFMIRSTKESLKIAPLLSEIHPQVALNFLGEVNTKSYQSFSLAIEWEELSSPKNYSPYFLVVNAALIDSELNIFISQDETVFTKTQQELFFTAFQEYLDSIHEYSDKVVVPIYSPSDFGSCLPISAWDDLLSLYELKQMLINPGIEQILPLLPSHKAIYLYALKHPNSTAYFQQVAFRFEGVIDPSVIQETIDHCIATFPVLRSVFFYKKTSEPQRIIKKASEVTLFKIDGSFSDYLTSDSTNSFLLDSGPLIRFAYQIENMTTFCLLISYHHIIMDGWGLTNFFRYFLSVLSKIINRLPIMLIPQQLLSFKTWEATTLSKDYWKSLLSGIESPSSMPRLTMQNFSDKKQRIIQYTFDQKLSLQLTELAKNQGVSLACIINAMWGYLLSMHSGRHDLIFGTVISGRNQEFEGIERQVDHISMTIPVRVHLCDWLSLIDIARNLQTQLRESEKYLQLSTGEIQAESPLKQHLFDHILVFENYPFAGDAKAIFSENNLPFSLLNAEMIEQSHYELTISFLALSSITLEILFDPSVFDGAILEQIPSFFEQLMKSLMISPNAPIYSISIFADSSAEKKMIDPLSETIIDRFRSQALKTPDSIALSLNNQHMSYNLLNQLSDELAHLLILQGIHPEEVIGIQCHRSIEWVIIWLGILKAGAVCMPISLDCPTDRLSKITQETELNYIFINNEPPDQINEKIHYIDYNELKKSTHVFPLDTFPSPDPKQLAYILYTSGSTGTPKGIAVPHQAVMNHFSWIADHFKLRASDRMLQHTAFTFDVSICEFYSLFAGGTLILFPENKAGDVMALTQVIQRDKVTFLQIVPSLFETLLVVDIMDKLDSVRQVLCGADVLKSQYLHKWFEQKKIPLTNLYGVTEACIDSTYYDCDSLTSLQETIPIGKAHNGVSTYLLNDRYQTIPSGVPGNLYIGGHGLARGYYRRPDLTAQAFIPDPHFSSVRMYDTHDRAKFNRNGDLEFLGRSDNQIKLRGLRIELDEIRTFIGKYPNVKAAFVMIHGEGLQQSIFAYYLSEDEIQVDKWQTYLSHLLPHYMIPSFFIRLNTFPLTGHGKIDISQLPISTRETEEFIALSTIETKVADCWAATLQIEREDLNPNANFFELGGNSLTMIQLQYQINKEFERQIPITTFFEFPTIRSFASCLEGHKSSSDLEKLFHHLQMKKKYHKKKQVKRTS